MYSAALPSRSRKGALGLRLCGPWSSKTGAPLPPRMTSRSMPCTSSRSGESGNGRRVGQLERLERLQLGQDFGRGESEAFLSFLVSHQTLAGHHDQPAEAPDSLSELLDLAHDRIRVAGEH